MAGIDWTNWVTPTLAANPGAAMDVANSTNPAVTSQVVSHAVNTIGAQDGIAEQADANGTQSFWGKVGNGLSTAMSWAAKPLQEIQKDYKFIHSVYTNNGFLPGFAATLGVIGGGALGALAGPAGMAVGADVAAAAERKLANLFPGYKQSVQNSEDPNYKVSAGRDFTNVIGSALDTVGLKAAGDAFKSTDKGLFGSIGSFVSGITDAGFDVEADPINIIGRFGQAMRGGNLLTLDKAGETQLKYPLMRAIPGVKNFLDAQSGVALTSDQIDAVRQGTGVFNSTSRNYNRAIQDIADTAKNAKTSAEAAGEIAAKYPQLGTIAAGRLGSMDNVDEVHQFFKTGLYFDEMSGNLAGHAMLPQRTLLRAKFTEPLQDQLKVNKLTSGVYKTFSGYMPYSVDAQTGKLSLTQFRWNAPDAATTVYRIARFGMGDSAAKEMAGKYAEAVAANDINAARAIKNQTYFESLKAMGLPDDNFLVKKAFDETNSIDEPLVGTQIYGSKVTGEPLGEYVTKTGDTKVDGINPHHANDMFNIPDFYAMKRAVRDLGRVNKVLGQADDFIADKYTNTFFKPLALATAGFGLRVAAAELIPTFARYGIVNTFKAKLAASAAKADYDLTSGEAKHILPAALTSLGISKGISNAWDKTGFPTFQEAKARGLKFAAKMTAPEQMDLAQQLIMANKGHILSEAVSPGHGDDAMTAYQSTKAANYYYQIQRNSPMFRDLPEYTTYSVDSPHFVPRYATNLLRASQETVNKNIASDFVKALGSKSKLQIEDHLDYMPQHAEYKALREDLINKEHQRILATLAGDYKPYNAESKTLLRWQNQDPRAFAADRVDNALGMMIGKDGTVLKNVAKNLSNGDATDLNEIAAMAQKMPKSMPAAVAGPMLEPYVGSKNWITTIANLGFKKVMDPIVSNLSREPLYLMHVADAYAKYVPMIENGTMEANQALRFAQTQATYGMLPQIHNTALRNQFAQLSRNFLPFYFAQEQALKRAFRTLKDTSIMSPAFSRGLRFYQLAEHALSDPTFMETDDQGNKYIYIPGAGAFGEAVQGTLNAFGVPMVSGLPLTVKGSMTSLKSVLPELQTPGVSPFLAVSGNILSDFFPALNPVVKGTIGDISFKRGMLDTVVPAAWFKSAVDAAGVNGVDFGNQYSNALSGALAAAYYHGQVPSQNADKWQLQNYVNRIKDNARSILIIKSVLGLLSPLAPQVSQEDAGLRDEFWKLVKQKGNYNDALMTFLGEHGSSSVSYTVSKTENMIPGAKYPYVQGTVDFIKNNPQWFSDKSNVASGAFFLIPQDPTAVNDKTVYNELLNMGLRSTRAPQDLLTQFYIAEGDALIAGDKATHTKIIAQAKANYDTFSEKQENDRWSAVMTKMKNLHPIWYDSYTNQNGKNDALNAYNQLQQIFSSPNAPTHDQANLVRGLMNDYSVHAERLNQFKMMNLQGPVVNEENQNWQNHLDAVALNEPRLAAVIQSVFSKLG